MLFLCLKLFIGSSSSAGWSSDFLVLHNRSSKFLPDYLPSLSTTPNPHYGMAMLNSLMLHLVTIVFLSWANSTE